MTQGEAINYAACELAKSVAAERKNTLVAGGVCQTPSYLDGKGKDAVQNEFRKQLKVFVKHDVDFLICEYFEHIEEIEWAIEACKETGKPVAATMCIGPNGDMSGVSLGECGVRLAKAGACCIGINCHFDPLTCVKTVCLMKKACEKEGIKVHYMCQPLAYHTPDCSKQGFIALPEFPFALEPRIVTRFDVQAYARKAYESGIRYIGGCCGFEPYHIRAITEELINEKRHAGSANGFPYETPAALDKHGLWGSELKIHTKPFVRTRANRNYWENLKPASGRPYCASLSRPHDIEMHPGDKILKQGPQETSEEDQAELLKVLENCKTGHHIKGGDGNHSDNLLLDFN
ncbi:unnamed protein product [Gordionus sp. m RMFG-2023]